MASSATQNKNALMDKLGFDDETLTANRDGYMTKAQRERLRQTLEFSALAAGLFMTGFVVAAYFLIRWLLSLSAIEDAASVFLVILGAAGVICIPWLMYTIHTQQRQTRSDLEKGTVLAACGPAHLEVGWRVIGVKVRTRNTHQLTIDSLRFAVSDAVLLAFHDGSPYCVYYLPHRKIILSAEPLT